MKVLIVGVTGLVGAEVASRLAGDGHEVVGVSRSGGGPAGIPAAASRDLATAKKEDWITLLGGVDVVVNCAGTLQDGPRDSTAAVHADGPAVLFAACEDAGVRRVIHFSAIGVDRKQPSEFSRSKLRGDDLLAARAFDWVILRPSVILGRRVYGASALVRGLAALPVLPVMPDTAPLQVVQLDNVVETVVRLIEPGAESRMALELVGPERLSFEAVVAEFRRWLGWKPAQKMRLPPWLATLFYRAGDLAGMLGWQPALRSTARAEMVRGAVGDGRAWSEVTGIRPRSLRTALDAEPASVQDRWFARLYFLKPLIFVMLSWFWIVTGVISLTLGYGIGLNYLVMAGAATWAGAGVVAGALADIVIGVGLAWRPTTRLALWAAVVLSLGYAAAASVILPVLWADPLGPLLKIGPIVVLHFVAMALLPER